jgi:hypothetical protein
MKPDQYCQRLALWEEEEEEEEYFPQLRESKVKATDVEFGGHLHFV